MSWRSPGVGAERTAAVRALHDDGLLPDYVDHLVERFRLGLDPELTQRLWALVADQRVA